MSLISLLKLFISFKSFLRESLWFLLYRNVIWKRNTLPSAFPIYEKVPWETHIFEYFIVSGSVHKKIRNYALVAGGVSKCRMLRLQKPPLLPMCCLSPLLSNRDVDLICFCYLVFVPTSWTLCLWNNECW